jgi:hypothetical protein
MAHLVTARRRVTGSSRPLRRVVRAHPFEERGGASLDAGVLILDRAAALTDTTQRDTRRARLNVSHAVPRPACTMQRAAGTVRRRRRLSRVRNVTARFLYRLFCTASSNSSSTVICAASCHVIVFRVIRVPLSLCQEVTTIAHCQRVQNQIQGIRQVPVLPPPCMLRCLTMSVESSSERRVAYRSAQPITASGMPPIKAARRNWTRTSRPSRRRPHRPPFKSPTVTELARHWQPAGTERHCSAYYGIVPDSTSPACSVSTVTGLRLATCQCQCQWAPLASRLATHPPSPGQ